MNSVDSVDSTNGNAYDDFASSDDEIPLSFHKKNILIDKSNGLNGQKASDKKDKLKRDHKIKRVPGVYLQDKNRHKNGKKILHPSDSESDDFEKYTFFDENKTKRKIKINPDLDIPTLEKQIEEVQIENICLTKEQNRINEIKLKERLKLRMEIKRLKANIIDLELNNVFKTQLVLDIGNTNTFINALKKQSENLDYSKIELNSDSYLYNKLKDALLTDSSFWQEFNTIEFNTEGVDSKPYWVGHLKYINPDSEEYYKPEDLVNETLKKNLGNKSPHNVSYADLISKDSIDNNHSEISEATNSAFNHLEDDFNSCHSDSSESLHCNEDWNRLATKSKLKKEIGTRNNDKDDEFEKNIASNIKLDVKNENSLLDENISDKLPSNDIAQNSKVPEMCICIECGFDSSWTSFISRHREAYQNGIKLTPCNTCNMKFLKSGHFQGKHRLKRPPPKKRRPHMFMCDICGQGCTSQSGLSQHRSRHEEPNYPCPHCPYKCRRKGYLKKHIETHTKQPYASAANSLKVIKKKSTLKKYKCDHCDYVTETFRSLKLHNTTHFPEKSYTCKECFFTTKKSSTLAQHMRNHTGEKPYQCTHCSYKTSCKSYLKSHIRYHTGEKPFKCDQCPYQCVTSTRLNIHRKTHSGDKPFLCNICDYRCTTSYDLKIHIRYHTGENTIQCQMCDYKCFTLARLKTHMKKHASVDAENRSSISTAQPETAEYKNDAFYEQGSAYNIRS